MTDYELIRSKRRSLELRVLEDGRVQVRAPQRAPLRMVQAFVDSRRQWIRSQQLHRRMFLSILFAISPFYHVPIVST